MITAYEDTCFYALSGAASEKEEGSSVSGDNFSLFSMENGHYHVCVPMVWEAPSAFRESDMVVELMQKFMEAGFPSGDSYPHDEFGNGLQGDRESYSTLDFMDLDLYSGQINGLIMIR